MFGVDDIISVGMIEMQVRYINAPMGYCGKWMLVNAVQEEPRENKY